MSTFAASDSLDQANPLPLTEEQLTPEEREKRRLFGLLKKKDTEGLSPSTSTTNMATLISPSATTPAKAIPRAVTPQPHQTPPSQPQYFPASPQSHVSPSRYIRSPSPGRLASPASSLIFERNVQEQPLPDDLQAAIPHHIQTEDHIPASLEASSLVITDTHLNPDEVEIVTHAQHQPASASVVHDMGSGTLSPISLSGTTNDLPTLSPSAFGDGEETASHYGSLDSADVRRLSFISFADVVQGEHMHAGDLSSLSHSLSHANSHTLSHANSHTRTSNRSPSPLRSPASSHAPSPPTSGAPSVKGFELPGAFPGSAGSFGQGGSPGLVGGELSVETMGQALRKTGSGDLGGGSLVGSPVEARFREDATFPLK